MDVLFLTGAGSEPAQSIARRLVPNGYRIYAFDSRFPEQGFVHPDFIPVHLNPANPAAIQAATAEILTRESTITGVILAGNYPVEEPFEATHPDDIPAALNAALTVPLLLTRAALPGLVRLRGHIIALTHETPAAPGIALSATLTGALAAFTRALFDELRNTGVRTTHLRLLRNAVPSDPAARLTRAPQSEVQPDIVAETLETLLRLRENNALTELTLRPQATREEPHLPVSAEPRLRTLQVVRLPQPEHFPPEQERIYTPRRQRPDYAPPPGTDDDLPDDDSDDSVDPELLYLIKPDIPPPSARTEFAADSNVAPRSKQQNQPTRLRRQLGIRIHPFAPGELRPTEGSSSQDNDDTSGSDVSGISDTDTSDSENSDFRQRDFSDSDSNEPFTDASRSSDSRAYEEPTSDGTPARHNSPSNRQQPRPPQTQFQPRQSQSQPQLNSRNQPNQRNSSDPRNRPNPRNQTDAQNQSDVRNSSDAQRSQNQQNQQNAQRPPRPPQQQQNLPASIAYPENWHWPRPPTRMQMKRIEKQKRYLEWRAKNPPKRKFDANGNPLPPTGSNPNPENSPESVPDSSDANALDANGNISAVANFADNPGHSEIAPFLPPPPSPIPEFIPPAPRETSRSDLPEFIPPSPRKSTAAAEIQPISVAPVRPVPSVPSVSKSKPASVATSSISPAAGVPASRVSKRPRRVVSKIKTVPPASEVQKTISKVNPEKSLKKSIKTEIIRKISKNNSTK